MTVGFSILGNFKASAFLLQYEFITVFAQSVSTLMTIFPMFLLASMCLWASAMSSRLNVRSITGLRVAGWSEKYGNTLPVKAFTRSALYCERKMQSTLTWVSAEMTKHSCCVTSVFNSYLQAARAEETSEQVASLGQQFAQQISLYRPPSHGAVQHPPAIDGQRAHIWLPVAPTNAIKDHICSLACEIRDFTITGNCPSPIQSRSWFKIAPNQRC